MKICYWPLTRCSICGLSFCTKCDNHIHTIQEVWVALQTVPSYAKRYTHIKQMSDTELAERLTQLDQECPDL